MQFVHVLHMPGVNVHRTALFRLSLRGVCYATFLRGNGRICTKRNPPTHVSDTHEHTPRAAQRSRREFISSWWGTLEPQSSFFTATGKVASRPCLRQKALHFGDVLNIRVFVTRRNFAIPWTRWTVQLKGVSQLSSNSSHPEGKPAARWVRCACLNRPHDFDHANSVPVPLKTLSK